MNKSIKFYGIDILKDVFDVLNQEGVTINSQMIIRILRNLQKS